MKVKTLILFSLIGLFITGCAKKEDGSKEPSATSSESSGPASTEESSSVELEVPVSQDSVPDIPTTSDAEPFFGPWACTLTLGSLGTSPAAPILLLTDPNVRTNADAYPLYEKAITGIGSGFPSHVPDLLKIEGAGFPLEEAVQILESFAMPLTQLEVGSQCRRCTWPKVKVGAMVPQLNELRHLIFLVALKARVQIEQRHFTEAVTSLQVGLALTHHLGQAPLVIQGQVAIAMGSIMARQLKLWIQTPGAPSLYGAIAVLPPSFVDVNKQFQYEADNMGFLQRRIYKHTKQQILDPAQARILFIQKRANRDLFVLQTVEALRLYASTHQGQFPKTLAELTRPVPDDPTTGKPFGYRLEQGTAIIESTPKEASPKERLQYILTWQAVETIKRIN